MVFAMRTLRLTSIRSDDAANLTGDAGRPCPDMRDLRHDRRIKRVHDDLVGLPSSMLQLEWREQRPPHRR